MIDEDMSKRADELLKKVRVTKTNRPGYRVLFLDGKEIAFCKTLVDVVLLLQKEYPPEKEIFVGEMLAKLEAQEREGIIK